MRRGKVRIIEKTLRIEDVEPEVCERDLGGFFDRDEEICIVKLRVDEDNPNEIELLPLRRRD
jgi:hypothetical protein